MDDSINEDSWTVSIQPAITVGARATTGDYDIKPQEGGIWFHSYKGNHRFVAIDHSELPTVEEIKNNIDKVAKWFSKSEPR